MSEAVLWVAIRDDLLTCKQRKEVARLSGGWHLALCSPGKSAMGEGSSAAGPAACSLCWSKLAVLDLQGEGTLTSQQNRSRLECHAVPGTEGTGASTSHPDPQGVHQHARGIVCSAGTGASGLRGPVSSEGDYGSEVGVGWRGLVDLALQLPTPTLLYSQGCPSLISSLLSTKFIFKKHSMKLQKSRLTSEVILLFCVGPHSQLSWATCSQDCTLGCVHTPFFQRLPLFIIHSNILEQTSIFSFSDKGASESDRSRNSRHKGTGQGWAFYLPFAPEGYTFTFPAKLLRVRGVALDVTLENILSLGFRTSW